MGYRPGGPIVLVAHDASWAEGFERESSRLRGALENVLIELHHIGSTAIPGIVAKPVIDMLAVVTAVEALDEQSHCVEALGYDALGEFGIPGRRYFRRNAGDVRTHQIHAYATGSPEIQRHLDFRDFLREHPVEARDYETLKNNLAQRNGIDVEAYATAKTDFVREIERRAAAWRGVSGST